MAVTSKPCDQRTIVPSTMPTVFFYHSTARIYIHGHVANLNVLQSRPGRKVADVFKLARCSSKLPECAM